jgi:ribosome assembly protein 1
MKASSISLLHAHKIRHRTKNEQGETKVEVEEQHNLINLIDSPGHVEFSSEVSSALRMSDGALVLVDVNEGVSPQTHTVIKQAWAEKVRMCLVLNKVDVLMIQRGMDGQQCYQTMVQIVEQVNGIVSELIKADILESTEGRSQDNFDELLQEKEKLLLFCPEDGNVAFSSAFDCWSFTLPSFSPVIAKKLGMNPKALCKFMWGQFYYDQNQKAVKQKPINNQSQEMFVTFIMDPLVELMRKHFNEEVMKSTEKIRESHLKVKNRLFK